MEVRWSDNEEIARLLDTITHKCSYCGGPARVPEDVAAVMQKPNGELTAYVVCPKATCIETFRSFLGV